MLTLARRLSDWLLNSRFGMSIGGLVCGLGGFAIVFVQLGLTGVYARMGDSKTFVIGVIIGYCSLAAIIGFFVAGGLQRKRLSWWYAKRDPSVDEARAVLRLPWESALVLGSFWIPGVAVVSTVIQLRLPDIPVVNVDAQVLLGGLASCCLMFIIVDKVLGPVVPAVIELVRPASHFSATVAARVAITWIVASGVPLLTLVAVLYDDAASDPQIVSGARYIAVASLAIGAFATFLLIRGVAVPLRRLRRALREVGAGHLDRRVVIDSVTEVGLLETSVNDMTESLRERVRVRELFGRHVGADVADRALAGQLDLSGEQRVVTALFVDVVGSTQLAHELPPDQFVERLNRLLGIVVDATTDHNGLVNKFEGDAALCIFGAPIALYDDAAAALRTARRIRNEVIANDEFDVGIGVARGEVFAGGIGARTRLEYTVIGDPVNEAARLTEAAKAVPTRILVSQPVIDAADPAEQELWVRHGSLQLRGRAETTKSWTDNTGHRMRAHHPKRDDNASAEVTGKSQMLP